MPKIGDLELTDAPRIGVPLSDLELQSGGKPAADMADIFELRIDQFSRLEPEYVAEVCESARSFGVPLLGTIRFKGEGGQADISDEQRVKLYETILPHVDALDIEYYSAIRGDVLALAKTHKRPVIISYHNFDHTPPDVQILEMIERSRFAGAEIVKIAVTAKVESDTVRMLDLLRAHRGRNLIVISMGLAGAMSRVFFPMIGSLITFAYLKRPNALGQFSLFELVRELQRYSPTYTQHRRRKVR